ncbi:coiled-coil domain-containing protein [Allokutzneria albata]|uniref:DivIVA protein n=1 Tax=Allokutzneria albata TaxID=211114 RepID=A0A1G9UTK7_ALLAB|nr:hypothetical protein [Allokutzneria albata]SDM63230.1 hypothetical protein SAMN04489726_2616 [Allokutzneria albata]
MTAVDSRADLLPLRIDFDMVWRGYDPFQVQRYVRESESDLRLLAADRDAAVARADDLAETLAELRSENARLRAKIDRLCRAPLDAAALSERLQRMVELAREEAEEITRRATAAAERSWAGAEQAAARLRERYERMIAELDTRRQEMETEHRELMRRSHAEIEAQARQAEEHRRQLDERAERDREQVRHDFEVAMNSRRAEAMRALAEEEAAVQARIDALVELRDRIAAQVTEARRVLDDAAFLLGPEPDRRLPAPVQAAA